MARPSGLKLEISEEDEPQERAHGAAKFTKSGAFKVGEFRINSRGFAFSEPARPLEGVTEVDAEGSERHAPEAKRLRASPIDSLPAQEEPTSRSSSVDGARAFPSPLPPQPAAPLALPPTPDRLQVSSLAEVEQLRQVGSGSSGVVWQVRHKPSGRVLAEKIVSVDMTEQKCKQVVTELWTLAKSRSPYIVALQGAFYESGSIYILMEYMDCGALSDALRVAGRVPEPILAKIAAQVLRGLVYLHEEARVIHRDLKPSNILLSKEGRVKLVDFGVSGRVLEGKADANKSFVGTVTYMSPERLQGSGHFFDSDLWSLGLSLFECAVGRYPYQDEGRGRTGVDFWNIRELVLSRPAPALPDSFSMEFRSFVSTCLRKEHQNRPSASEMLSHSWIRKFGHCEDLGDLRAWLEQVARDRKARRKREQRAAAQRLEELRGIPEGSLSQP